MSYRYTDLFPRSLPSGRPLAYDDVIDLDTEELQDPFVRDLITRQFLSEIVEPKPRTRRKTS